MLLRKTGVMKMKTSGKMNNEVTMQDLFRAQVKFQNALIEKGIYERFKQESTKSAPTDDISLASYHIQQLVSEIGEILNADKRWKSHRNDKYDEREKLEEIADCFIVLMNVTMFSGFNENDIVEAIKLKLDENIERINKI